MDTKELLTVIGWPVTVLTGIASGFIISRLTRKRQILTWAVINEIELIPRALSDTLGVPVSLQVGDARPSSLSALTIRIGNSGNETIRDITLAVALNPGATILNVRFSADPGEYARHVQWSIDRDTCRITAAFVNPNQNCELEVLSSGYTLGTVDIDASAPGLELRRTSAIRWDALFNSAIKGFKLSIPFTGIGYDSGSAAMAEVAHEIKALRKYLSARP